MTTDIHIVEKNLIYILLHDLNFVEKWIEGPLILKHFHSEYHNILNAIEDAYDDGALLTRTSFAKNVEK